MQTIFDHLIAQLINPASAETQNAARMLHTPNPNDIPTLIAVRMNYQPPFIGSMALFNRDFQTIERTFAGTITGLNPDLWVEFVTAIRAFVQNPQQQQPQQPQMQQPQMQQQQQQMQQRQMQQSDDEDDEDDEFEPLLGHVPRLPFSEPISMQAAMSYESAIARQVNDMGGKRTRSKKRGRKSSRRRRKSIHQRKKSIHKKRK